MRKQKFLDKYWGLIVFCLIIVAVIVAIFFVWQYTKWEIEEEKLGRWKEREVLSERCTTGPLESSLFRANKMTFSRPACFTCLTVSVSSRAYMFCSV